MNPDTAQEFSRRLCPHRGIGKENSLQAIESGISTKPYFVEFDVQWHHSALYLGHPPEKQQDATLAEALQLFTTDTFPKVDIKLTEEASQQALDALIQALHAWSPKKALVNIAGSLTAEQYMQAESSFMELAGTTTLLNIDLERYAGNSDGQIITHIEQLSRKPFSISPNLDSDVTAAIDFAVKQSIPHIHFWASHDSKYPLESLYKIMNDCLSNGLEVYFDIKATNIATSTS